MPGKQPVGPETLDRSENDLTSLLEIKDIVKDNHTEINLSLNRIAVISTGILPKTLKVLDLSSNQLKDCKGLVGLPNLVSLDLSINQISSIAGIDLPALKHLSLQSNKLTTLKGVERLRALEMLNVDRNELKSLNFGGTNAALQEVTAQENYIGEIKPTDLSSLLGLSRLNLSKNRLQSLAFLEGLTGLEDLDVSHNRIEKLDIPKGTVLEDMYSLNLSHNSLVRLTSLPSHFPWLTVVNISHNEIMDEDELDFMLHINSLAEVILNGNDCFSSEEEVHARYRFLEIVNHKRFRPTGDRERQQIQEIVKDLRERGLMTPQEIKLMLLKKLSDQTKD